MFKDAERPLLTCTERWRTICFSLVGCMVESPILTVTPSVGDIGMPAAAPAACAGVGATIRSVCRRTDFRAASAAALVCVAHKRRMTIPQIRLHAHWSHRGTSNVDIFYNLHRLLNLSLHQRQAQQIQWPHQHKHPLFHNSLLLNSFTSTRRL